MMFNPRTEALAYRIWAYAEPLGWDVSVDDIAAALDVSASRAGRILSIKGWLGRLRASRSQIKQSAWLDAADADHLLDIGDVH